MQKKVLIFTDEEEVEVGVVIGTELGVGHMIGLVVTDIIDLDLGPEIPGGVIVGEEVAIGGVEIGEVVTTVGIVEVEAVTEGEVGIIKVEIVEPEIEVGIEVETKKKAAGIKAGKKKQNQVW